MNYNNKEVSNKFDKDKIANKREDFRGRESGDRRPGDKRAGDGGLAGAGVAGAVLVRMIADGGVLGALVIKAEERDQGGAMMIATEIS